MKEELKALVGYQPAEYTGPVKVHYLEVELNPNPLKDPTISDIRIQILRSPELALTLTEDEMESEVKRLLGTFSVRHYDKTREALDYEQASLAISKSAKRGFGNTRFETDGGTAFYYKGTHAADGPIIVTERDGLYGIFVHPKFQDYGFVMTESGN